MREISIEDCFGQAIAKYSRGLDFGVEIGGGTGDGSTQCIRTRELFSFEIHPDRIDRHQQNLDARENGVAIHLPSSNPKEWMTVDDVENFYKTIPTKLNQYRLVQVLSWLTDDLRVSEYYDYEPITLQEEIDFLLLDGGAFSGKADFMAFFPKVRDGGIIAIDDTNDIKNYGNYQWLKTAGHDLLWEEQSWRNGSAIFRK